MLKLTEQGPVFEGQPDALEEKIRMVECEMQEITGNRFSLELYMIMLGYKHDLQYSPLGPALSGAGSGGWQTYTLPENSNWELRFTYIYEQLISEDDVCHKREDVDYLKMVAYGIAKALPTLPNEGTLFQEQYGQRVYATLLKIIKNSEAIGQLIEPEEEVERVRKPQYRDDVSVARIADIQPFFPLPLHIEFIGRPENYRYHTLRHILAGSHGEKNWTDKINNASNELDTLQVTSEKDRDYLAKIAHGLKCTIEIPPPNFPEELAQQLYTKLVDKVQHENH